MKNNLNHLANLIEFNYMGYKEQVICLNHKEIQDKLDLVKRKIKQLNILKEDLELHLNLLKEI